MPPRTSFEPFADIWDAMTGEGERATASIADTVIFKLLGSVRGKTIYEPACGNGYLARALQKKGAKEVWASDISPALIAKAQERGGDITYLVRDAASIKDMPRNHFDVVVISAGIFYIKNLDLFLKNMHALLKPGGCLIFQATHPLFSMAYCDMGTSNKTVSELIAYYRPYAKDRFERIEKTWGVDGIRQKVRYWMYKRPISTYINACVANGFSIHTMIEPRSAAKKNGKLKKSTIPSIYIIKVVKTAQ